MRRVMLTILILFIGNRIFAQGINFEQNKSWVQVKAKAKTEHKYIFMDCYATWCGPCKFMSETIFPQMGVGDFMNENFISIAVQMDKTTKDIPFIKGWYRDAEGIAKQYQVSAYPTYLVFSSDGVLLDKFLGATADEKEFLSKVKNALNPDKQYYTMVKSFNQHLADSTFLHELLVKANQNHDKANIALFANAYLKSVHDPFTNETLSIISSGITTAKDTVFKLYLKNTLKIDTIVKRASFAEKRVASAINEEDIKPLFTGANSVLAWNEIKAQISMKYPGISQSTLYYLSFIFKGDIIDEEINGPLYKAGAPLADWNELAEHIKAKFPDINMDTLIAREKYHYYGYKKMWKECDNAILRYMAKYGADRYETNTIAFEYVFLHSNNLLVLKKAAGWMKKFIPGLTDSSNYSNSTCENMDTYANLLYKAGKKKEAIIWEKKALDISLKFDWDKEDQVNNRITMKRMQNGEKTWENRGKHDNYN